MSHEDEHSLSLVLAQFANVLEKLTDKLDRPRTINWSAVASVAVLFVIQIGTLVWWISKTDSAQAYMQKAIDRIDAAVEVLSKKTDPDPMQQVQIDRLDTRVSALEQRAK